MCIFGRSNLCCCCCCCWPNNWEIQKRKERKRTPNKQQTDVCVSLSLEFLYAAAAGWWYAGHVRSFFNWSFHSSASLAIALYLKKGLVDDDDDETWVISSSRRQRRASERGDAIVAATYVVYCQVSILFLVSSLSRWANFSFYLLLRTSRRIHNEEINLDDKRMLSSSSTSL